LLSDNNFRVLSIISGRAYARQKHPLAPIY